MAATQCSNRAPRVLIFDVKACARWRRPFFGANFYGAWRGTFCASLRSHDVGLCAKSAAAPGGSVPVWDKTRAAFCYGPALALVMVSLALAGTANGETRSGASEGEMVRLSEILGAIHHLREVCNANEGQLWRSKMQDLLQARETL